MRVAHLRRHKANGQAPKSRRVFTAGGGVIASVVDGRLGEPAHVVDGLGRRGEVSFLAAGVQVDM